jgi:hypothetical protein
LSFGQGNGKFSALKNIYSSFCPVAKGNVFKLADIDGDGVPDIICSNMKKGCHKVVLMNKDGTVKYDFYKNHYKSYKSDHFCANGYIAYGDPTGAGKEAQFCFVGKSRTYRFFGPYQNVPKVKQPAPEPPKPKIIKPLEPKPKPVIKPTKTVVKPVATPVVAPTP